MNMHEIRIGEKLEKLLENVNFVKANTEIVMRINAENTQFTLGGIKEDNSYFAGYGPGVNFNQSGKSFDEALQDLANLIKGFGGSNKLKSNMLVLPTGGVFNCNVEVNKLVIRYLEDYLPQVDKVCCRWDILINKEI